MAGVARATLHVVSVDRGSGAVWWHLVQEQRSRAWLSAAEHLTLESTAQQSTKMM
jgi:hypothetical protein